MQYIYLSCNSCEDYLVRKWKKKNLSYTYPCQDLKQYIASSNACLYSKVGTYTVLGIRRKVPEGPDVCSFCKVLCRKNRYQTIFYIDNMQKFLKQGLWIRLQFWGSRIQCIFKTFSHYLFLILHLHTCFQSLARF